jgi:hypothetical protein
MKVQMLVNRTQMLSGKEGSYKQPLIQQIAHAAFVLFGDEAALSLR